MPRAVGIAVTFATVLFGGVLFRAPDVGSAVRYAGRMLALSAPGAGEWLPMTGARVLFVLVLAAAFSFLPAWEGLELRRGRWVSGAGPRLRFSGALGLILLSPAHLSSASFNPFIYFRI